MGRFKPQCQNPQERLSNNREVSLGFTKKISSDEARRCPQCADPICLKGCPLGVDIPGFIRLLRESDAALALQVIKKENPFPAICGRICPAPCESACIFNEEDQPISIRDLERYASDHGRVGAATRNRSGQTQESLGASNNKKIAIVGSGPSAMAAASYLLKGGFKVEMFEAANEPGGLLRYGIPEFRLPQEILDIEFNELRSQGLELHTNVLVGRIMSLETLIKGFDAVLLATGASLPDLVNFDGENLPGVYYAEEFLSRLQSISKENILSSAVTMLRGKQTVVIGSGHAAIDAARMAARLNQEVNLIFGGLEEELQVSSDEVKALTEEGIKINAPYEPLKVVADKDGNAKGVECHRMEIIEAKEGLNLELAQEAPILLPAQTVILANGQKPNPFLGRMSNQLKLQENGAFFVKDGSFETTLEKVFALASAVKGPMSVVEAFVEGKRAAQYITERLE